MLKKEYANFSVLVRISVFIGQKYYFFETLSIFSPLLVQHLYYMTISRLHRVEIFNLLSFDHQVFDNIGELGIIIGPNNSGKSNFFKILEILKPGQSLKKKYIKFNEKISSARILLEFKFEKSSF